MGIKLLNQRRCTSKIITNRGWIATKEFCVGAIWGGGRGAKTCNFVGLFGKNLLPTNRGTSNSERKRVLNYHPHYIKIHPFILYAFWWGLALANWIYLPIIFGGRIHFSILCKWSYFSKLLAWKIYHWRDLANNQLF